MLKKFCAGLFLFTVCDVFVIRVLFCFFRWWGPELGIQTSDYFFCIAIFVRSLEIIRSDLYLSKP